MTDTATPPAVSIILTSYNRTGYLKEAIESIQHQTCSDWELLIVDDASENPGPRQIARQYAEQDPRIRTLFLRRNVGPAGARNAGIGQVQGQYICFQDDDDISHPRRLETQLALLRKKPEFAAVVGAIARCDDQMKVKDIWGPSSLYSASPAVDWPRFNAGGNASMIRREALLEAGGCRPWFRVAEDWDLCLRLQDSHPIAAIPETVLLYRRHADYRLTHDPMLWHYHCAALVSAHCRRTGRKDPIEDNPQPKALLPLFKDVPEPVRLQRLSTGVRELRQAVDQDRSDQAQAFYSVLSCCYNEEQVLVEVAPLNWKHSSESALTEKVLATLPQTAAVREVTERHSLLTDLWHALGLDELNHFSALMEELQAAWQQELATAPPLLLLPLLNLLVKHRIRIPKQLSRILLSQVKQGPACIESFLDDSLFCTNNLKSLMRVGYYRDIRFLLRLYAIGATQAAYLSHLQRMKGKALKYSLLYFKPGYWFAR